jgi:hypothetical protein
MKPLRFFGCAVMIAAMLAGCHPAANPLVGKWQANLSKLGKSASMTREFRADGTETLAFGAGSAQTEMTYTVNGNALTEKVTGMTLAGKSVDVATSGLPATTSETFSISGDKLTIASSQSGPAMSLTYERIP